MLLHFIYRRRFQVDNIDYLSNSDIESIEVLKDASSAAIYGAARSQWGWLWFPPSQVKAGRPVINYNGSASYRKISKMLDVLSPYEFVKLQGEIKTEHAKSPTINQEMMIMEFLYLLSISGRLYRNERSRLARRDFQSDMVTRP